MTKTKRTAGNVAVIKSLDETITQHLDAPIDQVLGGSMYSFASWSDGGAAAHDVTTPARGATYVANYLLS